MKKYKLHNLDCANCALEIEKAVNKLEGVKKCSINFATSSMILEAEDFTLVKKTIKSLEPEVEVTTFKTGGSEADEQKIQRRDLVSLIAAGILFLIPLLTGHFLGDSPWLPVTYIPAYLLSGGKVLIRAGRNILKVRLFDENFLMSLATLGAFVIGEPAEAVGVMFFFRIGEYLQTLSLRRSRRSIKALLALKPESANVKTATGILKMAPEEVSPGSLLVINPGEKVPLDGIIVKGNSQVDTSALSGESLPRFLREKETILAGMINRTHALEVRVTKSYSESSVAVILDLVENATARKARTEQFITRFARYYTPVVVGAAIALAVLSPLLIDGMNVAEAIHRAFVLLVISCPCALVLSIPLGYFVGISNASREGILVKGSHFLDRLAAVKTIIFDKTGTLTRGNFVVDRIVPTAGHTPEEVLENAASVEYGSNHPIASSVMACLNHPPPRLDFDTYEERGGAGIVATQGNKTIIAGNDKLLHMENVDHSDCFSEGTVLHVAVNRVHIGYIVMMDEIKQEASAAISRLKALGVKETIMLTGDNKASAERVATALKLDRWYADLLPAAKIAHLEEVSKDQARRPVAFVGDGINDSPIIAQADIGIAMGEFGSDAAIDVADIVLLSDTPDRIPEAVEIARKTRRVVRQNIIMTIGIKILFIVLGISGLSGMWGAVFADIGVSLLAVFNAIRIHKS